MKKNTMMRVASVLLVAVLLSTSVISGTFAKYVTSDSAVDTARVAKWGVVITGSGSLYGKNYETGEIASSYPSTNTTASALSVMSNNESKVVAPGTQGDKQGLAFSLNGTPEVRTNVAVEVSAQDVYLAAGTYGVMKAEAVNATEFSNLKSNLYTMSGSAYTKLADGATYDDGTTYYVISDSVEVANGGYYPVQYVNSNANADDTKITEIAKKIAGNVGSATDSDTTTAGASYTVSATKDPNVDLGTALKLANNKITWQWAFTGTDPVDKEDTILGNLAAKMLGQTIDVVKVGTDGAVTVLTVNNTSGIVMSGESEVGSVKTMFNISITATQVN